MSTVICAHLTVEGIAETSLSPEDLAARASEVTLSQNVHMGCFYGRKNLW
jgi:hypothetical protein